MDLRQWLFLMERKIAATLDRNGLRPARYIVTVDNTILMASEVGVLPSIKEEDKNKMASSTWKMLLVDLEEKRIISDDELKESPLQNFLMKSGLTRIEFDCQV